MAEGQDYKVELIDDLVRGARAARRAAARRVSLYTNGPFTDLCRGPHAPSTEDAWARSSCSRSRAPTGAGTRRARCSRASTAPRSSPRPSWPSTWSGSSRRKARDHRKLGRELGLFTSPRSRPGAAFWKPAGTSICNALVALSRARWAPSAATREVKTPLIYDAELWKTSGHWDKYRENMFTVEVEEREMGVKPMNCPGHCQLFAMSATPTATCRCATPSRACCTATRPRGVLHGLLRVRHFAQDDAHIFCTEEQVQEEVRGCLRVRLRDLRAVRLRVAPGALHAPRAADRRRRDVGPRRGGKLTDALDEPGPRLRAEPRRRRLLRAEDRHAHDRLARALLAAGHGAARLLDARALRAAATPAPTTPSTAR